MRSGGVVAGAVMQQPLRRAFLPRDSLRVGEEGEAGPEGAAGLGVHEPPILPPRPRQGEAAPASRRPLEGSLRSGKGRPQTLRTLQGSPLPPGSRLDSPSVHLGGAGKHPQPCRRLTVQGKTVGPRPHRSGEARRSGTEGPAPHPQATCSWVCQGFPRATEGLYFNSRKSPKQLTDPREV